MAAGSHLADPFSLADSVVSDFAAAWLILSRSSRHQDSRSEKPRHRLES
jgi:hypothetical protein